MQKPSLHNFPFVVGLYSATFSDKMSCNYADGLSPYENKGVLGTAEKFDDEETIARKCKQLADMIRQSKHTVIHTGENGMNFK